MNIETYKTILMIISIPFIIVWGIIEIAIIIKWWFGD